jgi:hypothetical protein
MLPLHGRCRFVLPQAAFTPAVPACLPSPQVFFIFYFILFVLAVGLRVRQRAQSDALALREAQRLTTAT